MEAVKKTAISAFSNYKAVNLSVADVLWERHHITLTSEESRGVSNHHHQQLDCLCNSLLRLTTKQIWKLCIISHMRGNHWWTSGFPSQRARNVEIVPMPWHWWKTTCKWNQTSPTEGASWWHNLKLYPQKVKERQHMQISRYKSVKYQTKRL